MAYISGPMTNSNSSSALWALMDAEMIATGWVLDDTVVISTFTYKVYKSPAAGNSILKDFWIAIKYTTVGIGSIALAVMEGYNPTTHLMTRPGFNYSQNVVEQTYYSNFGTTTVALNAVTMDTVWFPLPTVATASYYNISMTRDRIILSLLNDAGFLYAGIYTPTADALAWSGSSSFPLLSAYLIASSSSFGAEFGQAKIAFNRMPKMRTGVMNWNAYVLSTSLVAALTTGTVGAASTSDLTGKRILVNPICYHVVQGGLGYEWFGYASDVAGGFVVNTAAKGDTITIGSETWAVASYNGGYAAFMRAI